MQHQLSKVMLLENNIDLLIVYTISIIANAIASTDHYSKAKHHFQIRNLK